MLDDFSRYIIAWKLCTTMRAEDVTDTLKLALTASACDRARVLHKPKLLSDNGPSYIAAELAEWIDANGMSHVRGVRLGIVCQSGSSPSRRCHCPSDRVGKFLDHVGSRGSRPS